VSAAAASRDKIFLLSEYTPSGEDGCEVESEFIQICSGEKAFSGRGASVQPLGKVILFESLMERKRGFLLHILFPLFQEKERSCFC